MPRANTALDYRMLEKLAGKLTKEEEDRFNKPIYKHSRSKTIFFKNKGKYNYLSY